MNKDAERTPTMYCIEQPNPNASFPGRVKLAIEIANQIEALADSLATVVGPEYPSLATAWKDRICLVAQEVMRQYPSEDHDQAREHRDLEA